MSWLGAYLLRIVAAAFVLSLCTALVTQPRLARILKLAGGCFLVLIVVQPLFSVRWEALPDYLQGSELSRQSRLEAAQAKNEALMEALVQEQTETLIADELRRRGMQADVALTLRYDEALGAPIPWSIRLASDCTGDERAAFSAYLRDTLGIPEERQQWQIG